MLYTLKYRPPGYATLPRGVAWELVERPAYGLGFDRRTDLPHSRHRFGVIRTDRELTPAELEAFEITALTPTPEEASDHA